MNRMRLGRSRLVRVAAAAAAAAALAGSVQLATAGSAAAAVSTVVQGHSISDSATARKAATAACPAGTRVFGGGGDIVGGGHGVALTALKPVSTLASGQWHDSYVAVAEEDPAGYGGTWSVYAYAVCGTAGNLSIQQATLAGSAGSDRVQTGVNCPTGTAPLGMGAEITGGNGHLVLNKMLANYTPNAYGQLVGWSAAGAFVDENGYAGPFSLTSYAVCGTPLSGLSYRFADSASDPTDDKTALVSCPAGTRAYGAGGYVSYQNGQVHFDRMTPSGSTWNAADVEARTDQTGFGYPWFTEVEAICAA
jgi:hypothetical protein